MKKVIEGTRVVFTFEGGLEPVVLDAAAMSPEVRERAMLHGLLARLGDAAAIPRQQGDVVVTVTEAMRREAVGRLAEHYASGTKEWNLGGRGARVERANPTIAAIAEKRGCTYAEAEAWLAGDFLASLGG